ncbi:MULTISPECIES: hypothetical protein [Pseudescherichia]|uniref:hypothetical protein n=1 Tax=Pseudescherichia TaxID=2055880 RepID=UPI00301D8498
MTTLSNLIQSEIADFFAGFGGPGEPDIQSGEAQRQLTERVLDLLRKEREAAVPVGVVRHIDVGVADRKGIHVSLYQQLPAGTEVFAAPPAPPVAVPVRYMNRYTGACYTLEQQPDAASDQMVYVPLYDVAQPVAVPDDYFSALVSKARPAAEKAMRKFPQPNYVLLKVAEEAGEVVQAGVHYADKRMSWEQVEGEIVQLLAMLIRLVTEGDQINGVTPPENTRAAAPQQETNQ